MNYQECKICNKILCDFNVDHEYKPTRLTMSNRVKLTEVNELGDQIENMIKRLVAQGSVSSIQALHRQINGIFNNAYLKYGFNDMEKKNEH